MVESFSWCPSGAVVQDGHAWQKTMPDNALGKENSLIIRLFANRTELNDVNDQIGFNYVCEVRRKEILKKES